MVDNGVLSELFFVHTEVRRVDWTYIWSDFMRIHTCLKICHFLQSVVSITEGPKNKIMRKSGIHSSVPCWDSMLEQFLFCWVSKKNSKVMTKHGTELWMQDILIILFFGPSVRLTTDCKKWQIFRPICVLIKFDQYGWEFFFRVK